MLKHNSFDSILRNGSNVLKTNDGFGDVACDLTLRRSGTVSTGDGSID
ncbi:hypothetical protein [Exilibacterium tricleocarpae]|nr:hypothetical protein [Exilibacterium tricleocarpae]